jgi:hypothetical protein
MCPPDDEDMDEGEVVGSDDEDPDPLKLPKPLLRPGQDLRGLGDDMLGKKPQPGQSENTDPRPTHKPSKNRVFVSDVPTCLDAVNQLQELIEIPLNPNKVTAVDPDKPRKAFMEGVARMPHELEDPKENAHSIAETLAGIIRAAREVAAKDNDISLLEAARRVAQETEELLKVKQRSSSLSSFSIHFVVACSAPATSTTTPRPSRSRSACLPTRARSRALPLTRKALLRECSSTMLPSRCGLSLFGRLSLQLTAPSTAPSGVFKDACRRSESHGRCWQPGRAHRFWQETGRRRG